MSGKRIRLILFIVLAVVQLSVAGGAIIRSEIALRSGEVFRFKLRPVDPVDAFRGRYVALRLETNDAPVAESLEQPWRQKVYVPLEIDDEGFAVFGRADLRPPEDGPYLSLRSGAAYSDDEGNPRVSLAPPFRRYYMTEELAKEVDRFLWRRGQRPAWVSVRVWRGTAVVEELYVDGRPVREWLVDGGAESEPPILPTTEP